MDFTYSSGSKSGYWTGATYRNDTTARLIKRPVEAHRGADRPLAPWRWSELLLVSLVLQWPRQAEAAAQGEMSVQATRPQRYSADAKAPQGCGARVPRWRTPEDFGCGEEGPAPPGPRTRCRDTGVSSIGAACLKHRRRRRTALGIRLYAAQYSHMSRTSAMSSPVILLVRSRTLCGPLSLMCEVRRQQPPGNGSCPVSSRSHLDVMRRNLCTHALCAADAA
eukprot:5971972-Prymnesium_polylepis.1